MKQYKKLKEAARGRIQREKREKGMNKAFRGAPERLGDAPEGFRDNSKRLGDAPKGFGDVHNGFEDVPEGLGDVPKGFRDVPEVLGEYPEALRGTADGLGGIIKALDERKKERVAMILNVILLAVAPGKKDYIPHPDGDFDEFQKNFVSTLANPFRLNDGTAPILRVYLGVSDEDWNALLNQQTLWNSDFARGGKETNRRSSDITAKQETRKAYEKLLRKFTGEYVFKKKKAISEIKKALKLTVPDAEPSPVHSTLAPIVGLTNKGGSIIEFRCRHTTDATRSSMLRDYQLEVRYRVGTAPSSFDDDGLKTFISSRARFQIVTGGASIGKIFYCYVHWKHLHFPQFDGPWSNVEQIAVS